MTKTEVIAMARDVGMCGMLTDVVCTIDELERFAALVAAREREACAQVCESEWATDAEHAFGSELAALIRARAHHEPPHPARQAPANPRL